MPGREETIPTNEKRKAAKSQRWEDEQSSIVF